MNNKQAKEFILSHWKLSSGKRITTMLKKYWDLSRKEKEDKIITATKKIFNVR